VQISTGFMSWQRYCIASSSGRQPNFAALNRGRHLCLAGRPSRWALVHILVLYILASHSKDYDVDCLAFAILTHGDDNGMILGTDKMISIDSLLAPLMKEENMKHFAGKPKLVFVQVALFYGFIHRHQLWEDNRDVSPIYYFWIYP